jgi:hypothetical protein
MSKSGEILKDKAPLENTFDEHGNRPELPPHWPRDLNGLEIFVDCTKRVPWLPPEFGQGIKVTSTGRTLQVYISPTGNNYYHRCDLEKAEGVDCSAWAAEEHPPTDGIGRPIWYEKFTTATDESEKLISELEPPAHWPEGCVVHKGRRVPWLPEDWGQAWKETNTGRPLQAFIAPDGRRLFHRSAIEKEYFGGQRLPDLNLPLNGRGDPVLDVRTPGGGGGPRGRWRLGEGPPPDYIGPDEEAVNSALNNRARAAGEAPIVKRLKLSEADYVDSALVVSQLQDAAALEAVGAINGAELARDGDVLRDQLVKQGFDNAVSILAVFNKGGKENASGQQVKVVPGLYYEMTDQFSGKPCYQQVFRKGPALACRDLYLFWSGAQGTWKFGVLDTGKAGLAVCKDAQHKPCEVQRTWKVLRADFFGASSEWN